MAEGAGDLLVPGVGAAQGGGDRQVHVREAHQGERQRRSGEADERGSGGQPGEGGDVARYGQRQGDEDGPGAGARQGRADGEPGERYADQQAGRDDRGGETEAVQQEFAGALVGDDVPGVGGALFECADGEIAEGQHGECGSEHGGHDQHPGGPGTGAPPPGGCGGTHRAAVATGRGGKLR